MAQIETTLARAKARIVHVVRDAASVCWSNLRQYFTVQSLGYCYHLDDVVTYHGLYRDWTMRCEEEWPGRVRLLDYTALTIEAEVQTQALIGGPGLEWHNACLASQDNAQRVHTASVGPVRQAVYRGRSYTWAPYAAWVGEAFGRLFVDS